MLWSSPEGERVDWSSQNWSLQVLLSGKRADTGADSDGPRIWMAIHFHWDPRDFRLPEPAPGSRWRLVVDTALTPGFFEEETAPLLGRSAGLSGRSLVIGVEMPYIEP